jgi:hypothetical protein
MRARVIFSTKWGQGFRVKVLKLSFFPMRLPLILRMNGEGPI